MEAARRLQRARFILRATSEFTTLGRRYGNYEDVSPFRGLCLPVLTSGRRILQYLRSQISFCKKFRPSPLTGTSVSRRIRALSFWRDGASRAAKSPDLPTSNSARTPKIRTPPKLRSFAMIRPSDTVFRPAVRRSSFRCRKIENIATIRFRIPARKVTVTDRNSERKTCLRTARNGTRLRSRNSHRLIAGERRSGEAKYVRLSFNVTRARSHRRLRRLLDAASFRFHRDRARRKLPTQEKSRQLRVDLIQSRPTFTRKRARSMSVPGQRSAQANNMIDDQTATRLRFATGDSSPTAVIDLGKVRTLRRLSAVYSPRPATLHFYVLKLLPACEQPAIRTGQRSKLDDSCLREYEASRFRCR